MTCEVFREQQSSIDHVQRRWACAILIGLAGDACRSLQSDGARGLVLVLDLDRVRLAQMIAEVPLAEWDHSDRRANCIPCVVPDCDPLPFDGRLPRRS